MEISQALEQEEDYLNLLKAELFVVAQVYRKTLFTDVINKALKGAATYQEYEVLRIANKKKKGIEEEDLKEMAQHWI